MALSITLADFGDISLLRFLQAHLDDIAPTAPTESQHALDALGLQEREVRMWVARDGLDLVGTIALARISTQHEELKSMRTAPLRRGQGIASILLLHALDDAKCRGIKRVSLETGSMDFFAPARALYQKHGFTECGPFGTYREDPNSTFMTTLIY
ncbi:GNAT family N-acetyltransferase [Mycobacteroides abscessus subsp. abscessus]|uniref:GNAT family N-acetyltransferase n=1 Tax=Mycobacteroides abscessus TaxID=36809 RepID=UPI0003470532|nr:GNAT family N-acetyltransferase [Mycobacteroides abscessus]OLT77611.1 GNAT family N-acetyltransferase [Mycobacteroides abscessus subsp. abscessus]SKN04259.1 GCN5-related N-acetyltransferase [Mycobacteroides abscessus subsp. abscessus]SLG44008.1 GCN5-related N-acetyltransferase [Mycobacteroides abscessus subsp. abscessus]